MLRIRALTVCLIVSAYVPVGSVAAQPRPAETTEYRHLVDEAIKEYEQRHFEEARALFARAAADTPSARALRGVGMCDFELRAYVDSADNLEKALASKVQPLEGTLRTDTERLLDRARSFVARYSVAVEPKAAVVVVDGTPWQLGPNGDLVLEVGDHVLEFRAEGFVPEKQRRKVRGGEQEEVRILLSPQAPMRVPTVAESEPPARVQLAAAPTPVKDEERRPLYKNPWLWAGVGVVTAGVVTGVALATRSSAGGRAPGIASPGSVMAELP